MINVKVLFFGATADAVGKNEIEMNFEDGIHSDSALIDILKRYPSLSRHQLHFALNEEYVNDRIELRENDELAIFTAVSGG